jgi:hypothetical protein
MARTSALGTFLKKSKGKGRERQRQSSGSLAQQQRAAFERELFLWKTRGVLWSITLVLVLSFYSCGKLVPGVFDARHLYLQCCSYCRLYRTEDIPIDTIGLYDHAFRDVSVYPLGRVGSAICLLQAFTTARSRSATKAQARIQCKILTRKSVLLYN